MLNTFSVADHTVQRTRICVLPLWHLSLEARRHIRRTSPYPEPSHGQLRTQDSGHLLYQAPELLAERKTSDGRNGKHLE